MSENGEPLTVNYVDNTRTSKELEEGKSFLDAINRGGLIKPSNLLFVTCLHAAELFKYMRSKDGLRKTFLSSKNSRLLFQGIFLEKLEDENATCYTTVNM